MLGLKNILSVKELKHISISVGSEAISISVGSEAISISVESEAISISVGSEAISITVGSEEFVSIILYYTVQYCTVQYITVAAIAKDQKCQSLLLITAHEVITIKGMEFSNNLLISLLGNRSFK